MLLLMHCIPYGILYFIAYLIKFLLIEQPLYSIFRKASIFTTRRNGTAAGQAELT